MMAKMNWIAAVMAGFAVLEGVKAQALSGAFDLLTYNVAGLPEPLSSSEPIKNTPIISQRIGNYTIVHVQEDFNYHHKLIKSDTHPIRTETSGPVPIGSGLNTFSHYPFTDLQRVKWSECWIGSADCLTPKGFTAMRITVSPGVTVDFYNLHADAGDGDLDFVARKYNYKQLAEFIKSYSGTDNAYIIAGDTNTRYTAEKDPIRDFLTTTGAKDAWVELYRGGAVPTVGDSLECPFPAPADGPGNNCELIDKVLYRSSSKVQLKAARYNNQNAKFLRDDGEPLSDHFPVLVEFEWKKV